MMRKQGPPLVVGSVSDEFVAAELRGHAANRQKERYAGESGGGNIYNSLAPGEME
ncbi:hypothetical protein [Rhizobium sullae]|uniref:hypothetical protein n=1 Tax=Rhizobium sullae TaxID=50338 RepID=UPI0012FE6514|nr:hypothetical protein [Rhizobium sullae]